MAAKLVQHASKVIDRKGRTITTTLCGRTRLSSDGMNVAESLSAVTCKFCLRALARPVEAT